MRPLAALGSLYAKAPLRLTQAGLVVLHTLPETPIRQRRQPELQALQVLAELVRRHLTAILLPFLMLVAQEVFEGVLT